MPFQFTTTAMVTATNGGDLSNADFNNDIYGYLISLCGRAPASLYSLKNSTRTQRSTTVFTCKMKFNQLCHLFRLSDSNAFGLL